MRERGVLLPSLTFRSSGGLWSLLGAMPDSVERRGGYEVKRASSGRGFGGVAGSWRVVRLFLAGVGRGAARGGRVAVERWRADAGKVEGAGGRCRRSIAVEGPHCGAERQAANVIVEAFPCRGARRLLAGGGIGDRSAVGGLLQVTDRRRAGREKRRRGLLCGLRLWC